MRCACIGYECGDGDIYFVIRLHAHPKYGCLWTRHVPARFALVWFCVSDNWSLNGTHVWIFGLSNPVSLWFFYFYIWLTVDFLNAWINFGTAFWNTYYFMKFFKIIHSSVRSSREEMRVSFYSNERRKITFHTTNAKFQ